MLHREAREKGGAFVGYISRLLGGFYDNFLFGIIFKERERGKKNVNIEGLFEQGKER